MPVTLGYTFGALTSRFNSDEYDLGFEWTGIYITEFHRHRDSRLAPKKSFSSEMRFFRVIVLSNRSLVFAIALERFLAASLARSALAWGRMDRG